MKHHLSHANYSQLELRVLAAVSSEAGFSRKISLARKGNFIRVSVQPGTATKTRPPTVQVSTSIPGSATIQVSLSREATLELIQTLQDALAQLELDAVHGS